MRKTTAARLQRRLLAAATAAALTAPALACAQSYDVRFVGAPNGLVDELETVSTLASRNRPHATAAAILRTARNDLKLIEAALQAAGYYRAAATVDVERAAEGDEHAVIFTIDPGPKFRITEYRIIYTDIGEADRPMELGALEIKADGSAEGAAIEEIQQRFLSALWNKGYPAAQIAGRRAEADFDAGVATAVLLFESGPRAHFGEVKIDGAARTDPDYIRDLKTWRTGELFERAELVSYRDRLAETGLFASIEVGPGAPEDDGEAPVLVTLEERKRRTIGVGLTYSTSEGPGARLFFEYRNLFHRGERLNVEMEGSEVEQGLKLDFTKPLPNFPGSVFGEFAFRNETTDAYDARTIELGAGLSRKWLKERLETRGGARIETSGVTTETTDERTYFLSVPLSAIWNTEDDFLDPTRGVRAALAITPYTGSDAFTQAELTARTRIDFGDDGKFTAALRGRFGATFGSSLDALAANKRFYAGGGSSVRGYAYQAVGDLDASGAPTGGRSVLEGAVEGRAMVTRRVQFAAFIDAGAVSPGTLPEFSGRYFVGAGGGIRYHTPVGPIRFDAATPLTKRDSDRGFQLYISLGQPF